MTANYSVQFDSSNVLLVQLSSEERYYSCNTKTSSRFVIPNTTSLTRSVGSSPVQQRKMQSPK